MVKSTKETNENWHKDKSNWVWKMFYYNKNDDRIFVPKYNEKYGITLNFANPKSYLAILGMFAFFGFVIYTIETYKH
jgi:uncharacterized membrane protein